MVRGAAAVVAVAVLAATAFATLGSADESRTGERLVSAEWQSFEDPPAGRKIQVGWSGNGYGCQYRLHRAAARETTRSVTIKVLVHRREMREDEICTAVAAGGRVTVRLRHPLGSRKLRHAPTSDTPR